MSTVSVIIVSYNTAQLTLKSVEAVLQSIDVKCHIYIIDNASTDKTIAVLRKKLGLTSAKRTASAMREFSLRFRPTDLFPRLREDWNVIHDCLSATVNEHEVTLLCSRENLGFGRANNIAAAASTDDYVLFLNSDAFVQKETLKTLVEVFEKKHPETAVLSRALRVLDNPGILGAQLFHADMTLQRQGGQLPNLGNIARWVLFLDDIPFIAGIFGSYQHHDQDMRSVQKRGVQKVGWVGGTALMISQPCLSEIGGFDPKIFMYAEDIDLCWRADQKHWDVALAVAGEVIHLGSASATKKSAILGEIKGILYLWEKYYSPFELKVLRWVLWIGLSLRVLIFGILRQYGRQRIYREALALV